MRGLVWFKKDLRLKDNPALFHASQQCNDGLIAVYIIDGEMWQKNNVGSCQIEFILRGLDVLLHDLANIGIPLIIKNIQHTHLIPDYLLSLCQQHKIEKFFFNRELEVNEINRDESVRLFLEAKNIDVKIYDDQFILPYEKIRTQQKTYFKVFTAFKREWLKIFSEENNLQTFAIPRLKNKIELKSESIPVTFPDVASNIDPKLWPAGENTAQRYLKKFCEKNLFTYEQERDFPCLDTTSKLSPYLAQGMISARDCFLSALIMNSGELFSGNKGALTWMSELIWREFYRRILLAVPRVCMNKAYKIETENLPWNYNEKLLIAWQTGQTGFPLVDAAMRQLNATGWMHNRLRMVAAMFLSKNLFLDWRLGETYFAKNLIDYDFASNNGGWQWSASTGTDAVPYFRIFNPTRQSERFDPDGKFIRMYCPELKSLPDKFIHQPDKSPMRDKLNYPHPIVDYALSRKKVIAAFKTLSY